ncbi:bone morphogenetic protein receptor type-2-like [Bolinopsis microptera]|uniref:bone morphogenetic protein receptor type-2-like n=1 Tax=Bolinopsis microptera TaxID=2820187 RepID=UPI00307AC55B
MAAASITKVFMTTASLTTVSLMTVSSSVPILSHDPVQVARLGVRVLVLITMGTVCVTSILVLSYFVFRTRRRRKVASYKQVDGDIEVGESEHSSPEDDTANFQDEIFIKNGRFCKITLVKTRGGKMLVKKQHVQSRNFENEKTVFELFKGHHPSIVFCYDILTSKKTLLMGYYEKGNLRDYLSSVSLSCSQLINLVRDVFTAVSYIHGFDILQNSPSNISLAHRDIKTANFLVQDDGRCVLSDFDLSINLDTLEEDCSLRQVGTMLYMSPELLDCTMLLSAAGLVDCDLYSLGAVLWEIGNLYCQVAVGAPAAGYVHVYQPQLPAMYTYTNIVNLVVIDQFRPDLKKLELDTVESEDQTIIERLDECISDMMDTDCESRISAHCAFNRIFGITRQTPTQLFDT